MPARRTSGGIRRRTPDYGPGSGHVAGTWRITAWQRVATRVATQFRRRSGWTSRRHLCDTIIAGVAWSLGAKVVTSNSRDFEGHGVPVLAYGQTAA